jgi:hypothetical protein
MLIAWFIRVCTGGMQFAVTACASTLSYWCRLVQNCAPINAEYKAAVHHGMTNCHTQECTHVLN